MRIVKEHVVGLVVDLQERLVPVMMSPDTLISNCSVLIKGLQALSVPVIYSQQYTKGLGNTVPEITSLSENFHWIEKTGFSCMDEPMFAQQISNSSRTTVLICGIEAHVCVLQTAVDLKENGFHPVVVADAISSRHPFSVELAIERFRHEGILVTTVESLLFELTRDAKNPVFKTISALVK